MAHILIIDDEPLMRTMLRDIFERQGHSVQEAPDGRAGLALWRQNPADVVLTDIFMPEKDGIEVILEIKRSRSETKIAVMTGGGQTRQLEMVPAAMILGADRAIQKPFDRKAILALIGNLLGERASPDGCATSAAKFSPCQQEHGADKDRATPIHSF